MKQALLKILRLFKWPLEWYLCATLFVLLAMVWFAGHSYYPQARARMEAARAAKAARQQAEDAKALLTAAQFIAVGFNSTQTNWTMIIVPARTPVTQVTNGLANHL